MAKHAYPSNTSDNVLLKSLRKINKPPGIEYAQKLANIWEPLKLAPRELTPSRGKSKGRMHVIVPTINTRFSNRKTHKGPIKYREF